MNKKIALIILDGYGLRKSKHGNAIKLAKKPNLDLLFKDYPFAKLQASQKYVGLPKKQMGNSEVGHLNIGAGRIVYTGLELINKAIKNKKFKKNEAFLQAINHAKQNNSKLHIWGLTSYGGVHSNLNHIFNLVKLSAKQVPTVLHCIGDGRDVDPHSLIKDIDKVIKFCKKYKVKIATISGRYYAMDRDKRWDRIDKAYQAMVGNSNNTFNDIKEYINTSYKNNITDEFLVPAINAINKKEDIVINDNDSIIFANFRPDRARELSHYIFGSKYYEYEPQINRKNNLFFVTMMTYEGITPNAIAFPPINIKNTLGEVFAQNNLSQSRIAETEKYAHVTFFFDGGVETVFHKEEKHIIPSPKVSTYDLKPEMSAEQVCNKIIEQMSKIDAIIANFANCDMVGHTGNLQASIKAVEFVDQCIGKIYKKANELNATLFICADHGNVDKELTLKNKSWTAHTLSLVPFLITDKNIKMKKRGKLADIAPTILKYLNINIPVEMTGKKLIKNT